MCPVGSVDIKLLPGGQFLIQIYVFFVFEELIEFRFVSSMGAFDFAVESGRAGFNVDMVDP